MGAGPFSARRAEINRIRPALCVCATVKIAVLSTIPILDPALLRVGLPVIDPGETRAIEYSRRGFETDAVLADIRSILRFIPLESQEFL
jgi:hypothetical protein